MRIKNIVHKGLRRLYDGNELRGVPPGNADKLRKMLAYLDDMEDPAELRLLPGWKPHLLTGTRKGTWSLFVTRNWRLTFRVSENELHDLNLEDYH